VRIFPSIYRELATGWKRNRPKFRIADSVPIFWPSVVPPHGNCPLPRDRLLRIQPKAVEHMGFGHAA
jgi:hypothetical protein